MLPRFMAGGQVVEGALKFRAPSNGEAIEELDTQTITADGTETLVRRAAGSGETRLTSNVILFDCSGADRILKMPVASSWKGEITVRNISSGAYTVQIQTAAAASVGYIDQGEAAKVLSPGSGTTIYLNGLAKVTASADDFGADGIKTDKITESTSGADITIPDSVALALGTGKDTKIEHDGVGTIITHTTGSLVIDSADVNDPIVIRTGTDTSATGLEIKNNSDAAYWKFNPSSATAGTLQGADGSALVLGGGADDTVKHDGTLTTWVHTTGNLQFDNQAVTGFYLFDLGTDTSATGFAVRSDALGELFKVTGDGAIVAGAGLWDGCPSEADPDPSKAHRFFDDFVSALSADWAVTEDTTDCTQAVSDAQHGVVVLTNKAATDDNAQQIQFAQETFKLTSGKKLWLEFNIKIVGDATNSDFFIGLAEAEDLTGVADNMPANGFGFRKDDGDTDIDACSSDNGANVESLAVGTLVNNTFIRLGLRFDGGASGAATLTPYINGVAGAPIAAVTYATMAEVSPVLMIRNGDGVTTEVLHGDYVKVVAAR